MQGGVLMPRPGLTSDFVAALQAKVIRPFLLYRLQFRSDLLNLWTGLYELSWGGITWYRSGALMSVTGISEDADLDAKNVTLTLSGIPSSILTDALTEIQRGLAAQIYLGLFEADGKTIVPNPVLAYSGRIDQPNITDSGDTCSISVNVENPLIDKNRPVDRRYTDADQQMDHPGDLGCSFVNAIQHYVSYFGQLPQDTNR
jgi:hypothetical protein